MGWVGVEYCGVDLRCYYDEVQSEPEVGIPHHLVIYMVTYKGVDVTGMVRHLGIDVDELAYESFEKEMV